MRRYFSSDIRKSDDLFNTEIPPLYYTGVAGELVNGFYIIYRIDRITPVSMDQPRDDPFKE